MTIWNSNIIFPTIKQKQWLIANCRICFVCDSSIAKHFPTVVLWHSTSSASLVCLFLGPEFFSSYNFSFPAWWTAIAVWNWSLFTASVFVIFLPFDHFQRECRSAAIVVRFWDTVQLTINRIDKRWIYKESNSVWILTVSAYPAGSASLEKLGKKFSHYFYLIMLSIFVIWFFVLFGCFLPQSWQCSSNLKEVVILQTISEHNFVFKYSTWKKHICYV